MAKHSEIETKLIQQFLYWWKNGGAEYMSVKEVSEMVSRWLGRSISEWEIRNEVSSSEVLDLKGDKVTLAHKDKIRFLRG